MKTFDVQPVLGTMLPDVASFLHRCHTDLGECSTFQPFVRQDARAIERCLRWHLLENPLTTEASQHGFCIRDASGEIRGLSLNFPATFLVGDRRLLGLGSGSFLVEPQARTGGFYLFKSYLNSPGYSFFFATTCNAKSAVLWAKLGGSAVPDSDTEYILPLKLDVLLPALLEGRTSSRMAAKIARTFGRCANPVLQLFARGSGNLSIEPCRDWEKLSELFRRHRSANLITTERSAPFLQWRYGPNSPNHRAKTFLFHDKRGNEGWFSLDNLILGPQGQIRTGVLLDAIWPSEKMSFRDILPAILQRVNSKADAFLFRPRRGFDYGECSRWIVPRKLKAPLVWAISPKGDAPFAVSSLDLVMADGDGGWSTRYPNDSLTE